MNKETIYAIKAVWKVNKTALKGYFRYDAKISFVTDEIEATVFKSKVLCMGWMLKVKAYYPTYQLEIVSL